MEKSKCKPKFLIHLWSDHLMVELAIADGELWPEEQGKLLVHHLRFSGWEFAYF